LLEGGIEFTVAVTTLDVVVAVELQAARKDSSPSAPAPTRAERCKKLLRLKEDPKFGFVPMNDLLGKKNMSSLCHVVSMSVKELTT
jgi:hypothetical protein